MKSIFNRSIVAGLMASAALAFNAGAQTLQTDTNPLITAFEQEEQKQKALSKKLEKAAGRGDLEGVKQIVAEGATNYWWASRQAAHNGHLQVVQFFFEKELREQNTWSQYPLISAINASQKHIVEFYAAQKIDLAYNNSELLRIAAAKNNIELVRLFITRGLDINTQGFDPGYYESSRNAYVSAAANGNMAMMQLLEENKIDLPLYIGQALEAAVKKKQYGVIDYILDQHVGILTQKDKDNALTAAIYQDTLDIVQRLTQAGANLAGDPGRTLSYVIRKNNDRMLDYMLAQGVDPFADSYSNLSMAGEYGDTHLMNKLLGLETSDKKWGATAITGAILGAAEKGNAPALEILLRNKGNEISPSYKSLAMWRAASSGKWESVRVMLKLGIDPAVTHKNMIDSGDHESAVIFKAFTDHFYAHNSAPRRNLAPSTTP